MKNHRPPSAPCAQGRRAQRGVGLIEVLVSVLIVTVGLLGAVALQATALRNNQGSFERTQTSILTQGIFDAMRANLAGVTANGYNTGGFVCVAPAAGSLATRDIARWVGNLHAQINPGACGSIACAANVCTVSVQWDDSRATGGSNAQTITMRAQL
ncbi:MAG: type IV pilus modification protein PilV [Rubrivivax sp.]|nr:type IV pilus modification protein PilV [Rubrivivax sp.]